MKYFLTRPLKYVLNHLIGFFLNHGELRRRLDINIESYWAEKKTRLKNPLNQFGEKYYSQSDEDGILLEIVRRLGIAMVYLSSTDVEMDWRITQSFC